MNVAPQTAHQPASCSCGLSASESLQQRVKQAAFSPLPSSPALLCSPFLPPLWHTKRKVSGSTQFLGLSLTGWGLLCSRRWLDCVHGHRSAPSKAAAAAAANTARSRDLSSIVQFFFPLFFFFLIFFLKSEYCNRPEKYSFI